jgi:hypothetical protein
LIIQSQTIPKKQDPAAKRARQLAFGMAEFFELCALARLDSAEIEGEIEG